MPATSSVGSPDLQMDWRPPILDSGMLFDLSTMGKPGLRRIRELILHRVQLAKETMIPLFKTHNRAEGTVIVPNSRSFMSYITGLDGDTMDPESMLTPSWKERWNGVFPFLCVFSPLFLSLATT